MAFDAKLSFTHLSPGLGGCLITALTLIAFFVLNLFGWRILPLLFDKDSHALIVNLIQLMGNRYLFPAFVGRGTI
jgi:hypothetical protein